MERYILTPAASVPLDLGPFMEAEAASLHGAKIGSFLEAGMPGTLDSVRRLLCVCVHRTPSHVVMGSVLFMRCVSLSVNDWERDIALLTHRRPRATKQTQDM